MKTFKTLRFINFLNLTMLGTAAFVAAIIMTGCSSSDPGFSNLNATHGSKAADGAVYGSGPDNTKPYPQSEPVDLSGVPGVTPKYEALSRGGNKNYSVLGKNYQVWKDCNSYLEIGTASWYGPGFHGNKTSNGEVYNQKGYSAAHKNLPLPSYLKVTNLENGKAVIVRVNDRGPFHGSRIIDLSEGAANAIDMKAKGTAKVKLEYIDVREGNVIANIGSGSGSTPAGDIFSASTSSSGTASTSGSDSGSDPASGSGPVAGSRMPPAPPQTHNIRRLIYDISRGEPPSPHTQAGAAIEAARITAAVVNAPSGQSAANYQDNADADAIENSLIGTGSSGDYSYVQIFTSSSQERAFEVRNNIRNNASYPVSVMTEGSLYRVRLGPVPENDLGRVVNEVKTLGYPDAFVKRL